MNFTTWLSRWSLSPQRRRKGVRKSAIAAPERLEDRTLLSGSGVFAQSLTAPTQYASGALALGDLDGDGDLDAFMLVGTVTQTNKVMLNDGNGTFAETGQELGTIGQDPAAVALGDLDGDGDLDAFVANGGANEVWLNAGDGTFTNSGQSLGNSNSSGIDLGDVDGDGDLDAFVANTGNSSTPEPNKVWLNDGSANFTDSGQNLGTLHSADVELGDLDGDGDLDAFVANSRQTTDKHNTVWFNDGNGNFSDSGQQLGNRQSEAVALGDLDGDGDLDAFVANNNTFPNTVWFNDGSGTFIDSGQRIGDIYSKNVALGDFDDDGDLDAFVANSNSDGPNEIWFNGGSGTFTKSEQTLLLGNRGIAVGDLDGDGDLDLFDGAGYNGSHIIWLNVDQPSGASVVLPDATGTFEILIDTGDLVVRRQTAEEVFRQPLGSVTGLTVDGTNDPDEIIVDLTGGIPIAGFALTVNGKGGDDVVTLLGVDPAFDGTITVNGQTGNDSLDGGAMNHALTLDGGAGDDTLVGGDGDDVLRGNADADKLNGQRGRDTLDGGPGTDKLFGGSGHDSLDGGPGNDTIRGNGGRDSLRGEDGDDVLIGGGGTDSLVEWGDVDFTLDDLQLTGRGTDELSGIEAAEITGGSGHNTLDAGGFSGPVTLAGGGGNDTLRGGAGDDFLHGGIGADSLVGQGGVDILHGGNSIDTLNGGAGDDMLYGGGGSDGLSGMSGNDHLDGGGGNDTMLGGEGDDTLLGQAGLDTLLGESGTDSVDGGGDTDTVTGAGNGTGLESDTVTGETIDDDFMFDAPWVNV